MAKRRVKLLTPAGVGAENGPRLVFHDDGDHAVAVMTYWDGDDDERFETVQAVMRARLDPVAVAAIHDWTGWYLERNPPSPEDYDDALMTAVVDDE